jgi:hypothetical protein
MTALRDNTGPECAGLGCRHPDHDVTAEDGAEFLAWLDTGCAWDSAEEFMRSERERCSHGIECADGVPACSECERQTRSFRTKEIP